MVEAHAIRPEVAGQVYRTGTSGEGIFVLENK